MCEEGSNRYEEGIEFGMAVVLALSLTACGGRTESKETTATQAQGQTERKNVRFHAVFLLFCIFAARSARLSVVKAEPAGGIMISNGIWF